MQRICQHVLSQARPGLRSVATADATGAPNTYPEAMKWMHWMSGGAMLGCIGFVQAAQWAPKESKVLLLLSVPVFYVCLCTYCWLPLSIRHVYHAGVSTISSTFLYFERLVPSSEHAAMKQNSGNALKCTETLAEVSVHTERVPCQISRFLLRLHGTLSYEGTVFFSLF